MMTTLIGWTWTRALRGWRMHHACAPSYKDLNPVNQVIDTVHKCFVNGTEVLFAAVPPCGTIEVTCNQVNFLRNRDGTESEDSFLAMPVLLA